MNPTEIYDALAEIAAAPFDPSEFSFSFAEATDAAKAAISKLRGSTNKSDLPGGVLFNRKFHYAPALTGMTDDALDQLRTSKKTKATKPAILIATDGNMVVAEHPASGDTLHCRFAEISDNFGFFLPAAGKERYRAVEENPIDVKATGKLARLYDALIKANPDWAFDDKFNEVGRIIDLIGTHKDRDAATGFDLVERPDGRILRIADLVDDRPGRDVVKAALSREIRTPDGQRDDAVDRAKVDIIIALGMAKEGFDWVWCEHALTIGYRSSLTEIVQIIGRATRDAPGKPHALFTNLVAEPGVETGLVADAVNDMLKAISGSLLMEQVLAPNFNFYRRDDVRAPVETDGQGNVMIGIKGLIEPPTDRARDICEQVMQDLLASAPIRRWTVVS